MENKLSPLEKIMQGLNELAAVEKEAEQGTKQDTGWCDSVEVAKSIKRLNENN